ncbi:MAG: Lipoprotein [Parcubacteria bacterium C7867-004]|nr:MAG: Lipoprotein [Parcubacteria bacterium C7867-004]
MEKNHIIAAVLFVIVGIGILALVPPPQSVMVEQGTPADTSVLIGTFEGTTPCADCPGIKTELTLVKDAPDAMGGTYRLSMTYLERDVEPYVTAGTWMFVEGTATDPNATVIALDADKPDQQQKYQVTSETTVRMLDKDGKTIDSSLPFDLTLRTETGS